MQTPSIAPDLSLSRLSSASPGRTASIGEGFETLLMGQLIKTMRSTLENGLFSNSRSGASHYLEMIDLELARMLVQRGGLGLAAQWENSLGAKPARSEKSEAVSFLKGARLTSSMGWRRDPLQGKRRFHRGIDLAAAEGTPVRSLEGGRVVSAGWVRGYGRRVVVEQGGLKTLYGHLSRIRVRQGERVEAGDWLGDVGQSGRATGPHLHLEMSRQGRLLNPQHEMEKLRLTGRKEGVEANKVASSPADKMGGSRPRIASESRR